MEADKRTENEVQGLNQKVKAIEKNLKDKKG